MRWCYVCYSFPSEFVYREEKIECLIVTGERGGKGGCKPKYDYSIIRQIRYLRGLGYSYEQISEWTDISPGYLRLLVCKARRKVNTGAGGRSEYSSIGRKVIPSIMKLRAAKKRGSLDETPVDQD